MHVWSGDRRQARMDKMDVTGGRAYGEEEGEELDPAVEWKQAGEEQDVVEIRLPGFRKEHVRVQVDNYGVLRVTGARPARGGRWVRFTKDLRLPDGCDADGVRARFEDDKLLITLPIVANAGDAPSPTTPSPEPLRRTSSLQPPSSLPPPPRLPPPPGKPNFFEPMLRPPPLPPRPPPPPPVKPSGFDQPKLRPPLPPPREPTPRPLPPFPTKPPPVFQPKPPPPPPPPQPPAKHTAFEPKLRPPLFPPRQPSSRPLPPFPAKPSTTFEPPPPSPPREPAPASLFPSRPPPPRTTSTSFVPKPPPPPPPPRAPSRLPSFPPPPPPKPTFFDSMHWLPGRHSDQAPAPAPEPTNPAADTDRKTWAPPHIVPRSKTAEPEAKPSPSPPPLPPRKESTSNVPEPKSRTLSDIPKSPILSDIQIAMASPSPPPPPPPPPRRRFPDAAERTKKHGKVRLPLLEEMKKKEKQKMEGRKAREAAKVGSETPPAVDTKREVASKMLPPASKDPTMTTTDLVANMAAAAAVLVGIALSVWRSVSSS